MTLYLYFDIHCEIYNKTFPFFVRQTSRSRASVVSDLVFAYIPRLIIIFKEQEGSFEHNRVCLDSSSQNYLNECIQQKFSTDPKQNLPPIIAIRPQSFTLSALVQHSKIRLERHRCINAYIV